jgi:nitrogen regulatory protein PII
MKITHEAIFCIVNSGYSDAVMDAARKFGARGGTVMSGRGTANPNAEKLFGITIEPEKDIVMIVVPEEDKAKILTALYEEVGLDSAGQGIAFALPVDGTVGLTPQEEKTEEKPEEKTEEKPEEK